MVEQGEILTLNDNKKYTVAYTANINSKNYAFLIETDNYNNTMLCECGNGELKEVLDEEILKQFLEKIGKVSD